MVKRSQTTGGPRNKSKPASEQGKSAEHKSRAEREAEIQRYVIIGTIVTVAVIALILLAAVLVEFVITPNQPVATVNGENITVAQFETRVRLERALLNQQINDYINTLEALGLDPNQFAGQEPLRTWLAQVQIPDQLGNSVINSMITDRLIRRQAQEMGISIGEEDIEREIEAFFSFDRETAGMPPTATPEPTITPTPFVSPTPSPTPILTPTPDAEATAEAETAEEAGVEPTWTPIPTATGTPTRTPEEEAALFSENRERFFASVRRSARVSDGDIRTYFETQAIRKALRDAVTPEITTEGLYVNARHILVDTEEQALDLLDALENNESFAALARAASTDTGSGSRGGELGWALVTDYVLPFAQAAEAADPGEVVGPIQSEFGYHILQVHGREYREITTAQVDSAKERRFELYLEDLRTQQAENYQIFPIWVDHIPREPAFIRTS
jgi:peptidyl-prolyl cis-trans isomerase D